ncbi:MAG: FAD-dependent oxidoreductase [Pseudomonadota bacterium]
MAVVGLDGGGAPRVLDAADLPDDAPEVPVAIVGGGACGLTAAVFLRERGVECVVLESDAAPRGSTALSSGFVPAPCTRVQRAAGVADDSVDLFLADVQAKAGGRAAPDLALAYASAIGPALDALQDRHGLAFELLDGFVYPGHSRRRMHALAERTGLALVLALEARACALGVTLLVRSRVRDLFRTEGGVIQGLGFQRPDGCVEFLRCRAVLLACNGFGGNAAMVREHLPELAVAPFVGHVGNDGSALAWGRALGAATADLSGCQAHGSWAVPHGGLVTWALMAEGGVQVNAMGDRFHDERGGYSEAAVAVLAQLGGVAWNVLDARLLALGREFPDFVELELAGAVRPVSGLADAARLIGCDEVRLLAALEGSRVGTPAAVVKVTGALFHTQGGLDVGPDLRVRRLGGGSFANLWAGGGAARGVSGDAVWGYLSGNGLLSAVGGGYVAANSIAKGLG